MRGGRLASFHVTLIPPILRGRAVGGIDEHATSEAIYAIMDGFTPIPVPRDRSSGILLKMKLHHGMYVHQILQTKNRDQFRRKICAAREQRIEGTKSVANLAGVATVYIRSQQGTRLKTGLSECILSPRKNGFSAD
jgi:hypothetical protein